MDAPDAVCGFCRLYSVGSLIAGAASSSILPAYGSGRCRDQRQAQLLGRLQDVDPEQHRGADIQADDGAAHVHQDELQHTLYVCRYVHCFMSNFVAVCGNMVSEWIFCTGIVSSLADERNGPEVYEKTFHYVLKTLMKVDEKGLAHHIAHYKQTAASRTKAWELKAVHQQQAA